MNARRLRIFVGMPCYGSVAPEVLEDWGRFMFHLGRRMPEYDFSSGIKTKSEQFRARNALAEAALTTASDYLLMIDDDQIIDSFGTGDPTADYDFLRQLLAHDVDIVGALYWQREGNCNPVAMYKTADGKGYRFLREDELTNSLQEVDVTGGGCMLIKMDVLNRLPFPYFAPEFEWGTDIQLCRAAQEKGFKIYLDSAIEIGHLKTEKTVVTSRNRHQFVLNSTTHGEMKRQFVADDVYHRLTHDACEYLGVKGDYPQLIAAYDVQVFHQQKAHWVGTDAEWYRQYPHERIVRQIRFNTESSFKRNQTEFILCSIDVRHPSRILDFGCGIGIPAFTFAEKGHKVTACDVRNTGTYNFLKWRVERHGVPMTFHDIDGVTDGGLPHFGSQVFDHVIAMDVFEHFKDWRAVLAVIVEHMAPGGVLFCNNGVLDDMQHAEHYPCKPKDFVRACLDLGLSVFNQITYLKPSVAAMAAAATEETVHA